MGIAMMTIVPTRGSRRHQREEGHLHLSLIMTQGLSHLSGMKDMGMDMDLVTAGGEVDTQGQEDPDQDTGTETEGQDHTMTDTAETAGTAASGWHQGPAAALLTLTLIGTMEEKKQIRRSVLTLLRSERRTWKLQSSVTTVSSDVHS